jgi:hypothetical protein
MKSLFAGAAALALLPTCAFAAGIDGTWKANVDTAQAPKKPEIYVITAKDYTCKTCTPPFSVPADGNYHPVKGNPYWDSVAIRLTSNSVTEMDFRKGKQVATATTTISADGKTATTTFEDSSASTTPVKGAVVAKQVAPGPKGSHPASGSWQTVAYSGISDNGLTITYKVSGDSVTMSMPTGQGYTAKLGGPPAPYKGDPGTDMVQVKMDGKAMVESDMRAGKVIGVYTTTPSADGKSISVVSENKLKGTTMSFTAKKQ